MVGLGFGLAWFIFPWPVFRLLLTRKRLERAMQLKKPAIYAGTYFLASAKVEGGQQRVGLISFVPVGNGV